VRRVSLMVAPKAPQRPATRQSNGVGFIMATGGGKVNDERGAGGKGEMTHTDLEERTTVRRKNLANQRGGWATAQATVRAGATAGRPTGT